MICQNCNFKNAGDALTCDCCGDKLYKSRLRIIQENADNATRHLFSRNYTIGRSIDNDIVIDDDSISRYHAELVFEKSGFSIRDLDSKNGSLLNNLELGNNVLRHEDCIQLGNVLIHYYDDESQSSARKRPDTIFFVQQEYFKLAEKRQNRITTDDVLRTVLDLILSLVDADEGAVLEILKQSKLKYKFGRGLGDGQAAVNARVSSEYTLFERALHRRETQIQWNGDVNKVEQTGAEALEWHRIAIPLLSTAPYNDESDELEETQVLGICYLAKNNKQSKLSRRKQELLKALVQQMSLAMENDMLHGLNQANRRLRRELTMAMDIKKRLMPVARPNPANFSIVSFIEPCETMSGDYFDLIQISDTTIGFAIGDVCGKGVPAALLSSTAQAAIRSQVEHTIEPGQVVKSLNNMFVESTASSIFLTLFFGILYLEKNELSYVNAGHPPPIYISHNREICELAGTAPPIGILESKLQPQRTIKFDAGDMLLMYTDGLIESQNRHKEIYGRKRFIKLIYSIFEDDNFREHNLDSIVTRIKSDLLDFTAGVNQADDLTFLAAKRNR